MSTTVCWPSQRRMMAAAGRFKLTTTSGPTKRCSRRTSSQCNRRCDRSRGRPMADIRAQSSGVVGNGVLDCIEKAPENVALEIEGSHGSSLLLGGDAVARHQLE